LPTLKIEISKYAQLEIEESKEYYNLQKNSLGDDFKYDVFMAFNNIVYSPSLYPNVTKNIKRCLLHRFPFSIFYTVKKDSVLILSVAHQHRKPKYF
jgi:hypothetical protein